MKQKPPQFPYPSDDLRILLTGISSFDWGSGCQIKCSSDFYGHYPYEKNVGQGMISSRDSAH